MPTTCANSDQLGLILFPIGIDQAGSRYGRWINLSKGYQSSPGNGFPTVVSFRLLEKRRPRQLAQQSGFTRVFRANPTRKAAKQHEDGDSRRRSWAAGGPEQRPRVLETFRNASPKGLATVSGWPDCLGKASYAHHRTGIAINKSSQSHCKL